jgi:hypothetical protein
VKGIGAFIGATLKRALVIFGLATCLTLLVTLDLDLANRLLFSGLLDYTPASEPALRHWGLMVFGIGALMVASAFHPWLQFSTLIFTLVETAFIVYLLLISRDQPWGRAYLMPALLDGTIALYCLVYFASSYGRPHHWVRRDANPRARSVVE